MKLSLAGSVVNRQKITKIAEKGRKKAGEKKRSEAPISLDYSAHFARKTVGKLDLISEETKIKMALLKRKAR
jgi:hypothetical protein